MVSWGMPSSAAPWVQWAVQQQAPLLATKLAKTKTAAEHLVRKLHCAAQLKKPLKISGFFSCFYLSMGDGARLNRFQNKSNQTLPPINALQQPAPCGPHAKRHKWRSAPAPESAPR